MAGHRAEAGAEPAAPHWKDAGKGAAGILLLLLTALLLLVGLACGMDPGPAEPVPHELYGTGNGRLTVFAAASLTQAYTEMSEAYRSDNPGLEIALNFDGSQRLRTQLEHGARADVFASADWDQMMAAQQSGVLSGSPVNFASNRLAFLVSRGFAESSGLVSKDEGAPSEANDPELLKRLAQPGAKVVLGLPEVPVGRYSELLLTDLAAMPEFGSAWVVGIRRNVVSRESNVRAIAQKVALGEADAGLAYVTDARPDYVARRVYVLDLPRVANAAARYPVASVSGSVASIAFVDFVLSEKGQTILRSHGFGPPETDDTPEP